MVTTVLSDGQTCTAGADFDIGACLAAAFGVAESYEKHRALYERLFGCVRFDRATHAFMVRADRFRAVMLCGTRANEAPKALGDRPLPIFSSGRRLVYLSAVPAPNDDVERLEVDLYRSEAVVVGTNAQLALPTPGNNRREWLSGLPTSDELPPYLEVVTAITRVHG